MKRLTAFLLALLLLAGCSAQKSDAVSSSAAEQATAAAEPKPDVVIQLSDGGITADGVAVTEKIRNGVYIDHDIVYYPTGQTFLFGEGTDADAHEPAEAAAHTVLHIASPGVYSISGKLSAGQIAVDLGENAENYPRAVVTLLLDGVDITCSVAPAIIFYNVYECGSRNEDFATATVNTGSAGANVFLADGSE